ncbi:hypothetical protein D9M71_736470 [compost metagenome]
MQCAVRRRGNAAQHCRGLSRARHAIRRPLASAGQALIETINALPDQGNNFSNTEGGAAGALGQLAHLIGDHTETATLLAGAGGLNGGIQRQQIGLSGNALDDRNDLTNTRHLLAHAVKLFGHRGHYH